MTILDNSSEDFAKRTFDFWNDDGSQVNTLDGLAFQLSSSRLDAAAMIATYPYPEAVPARLRTEAQDELDR